MADGAVVWMDVLLFQMLATFAFDWLLLWATAAVTKVPASSRGLTLGALLGTGYYLIYVLAGQGLLPLYALWRSLGVVLLVSLGMLLLAFGGGSWKRTARIAGHFYGIGFVGAGVGTVASFLFGRGAGPDAVAGFLAAGGAILLVAELGWGAVQRRLWEQLYQLPLELDFDGGRRTVTALVDTGNRLRDPLTGDPVVVIEGACVQPLLPAGLRPAVERMAAGDLTAVSRLLASEKWSARFRIIPFSSVGRRHGLLVAFRPDEVRLALGGRPVSVGPCVLGLCQGPLDPDGVYRALLHPELLESALARDGTETTAGPTTPHPDFALEDERRPAGDVARHSEI